jgi:acyl-CoA reductase-like NAD-dependent aldehyde dehydrogenase
MVAEAVRSMRLGSVMAPTAEGYVTPVDIGAMISSDRFHSLERLVVEAENDGATVEGGQQWKHVYLEQGTYFCATVVGLATRQMEIARTEGI